MEHGRQHEGGQGAGYGDVGDNQAATPYVDEPALGGDGPGGQHGRVDGRDDVVLGVERVHKRNIGNKGEAEGLEALHWPGKEDSVHRVLGARCAVLG